MKSDIEIARSVKLEDIYITAQKAGIKNNEVIPCGGAKAKVSPDIFNRIKNSIPKQNARCRSNGEANGSTDLCAHY